MSAERTSVDTPYLWPTFYQLQKSYSFSRKFIIGKKVLEMGCGPGYGTYKLTPWVTKIVGVDKDAPTIEKNKRIHQAANLKFICSEAEKYKPDFIPDTVLAFQFIEHLANPLSFLEQVKKMLKKDGLFIASVPNRLTQSSLYDNPYHFREYSADEFSTFLSKYFPKIDLYGVYGDHLAQRYEEARKKQVLKILSWDRLKMRDLLPRILKRYFLDILTVFNRRLIHAQNSDYLKITESNYQVLPKTEGAMDIIAVCRR